MVLYSFGFAAFLFTALPAETAGPTIRRAFPHFYLFVIGGVALSAVCLWFLDPPGAAIMAAIALTTIPTRQILMPAINAATDAGDKRRFGLLHGLSVVITLIHIGAAAYVLHRFIG
jgi:hypothetical protein